MDSLRKSQRLSVMGVAGAVAALALVVAGFFAATRPFGRAAAQDAPDGTPTSEPTTFQVSGRGSVSLVPDTASVAVGVTVTGGSLAEAQTEATAKMNAVLAAVEAAGVAVEDVATVRYNVTILYDRDRDREGDEAAITGYMVTNQISVKVHDFTKLGGLLDAVVGAGANRIGGIRFYVEDPSAAASQARRLAVQEALTMATEVADAAGLQVARIVSIVETSTPRPAAVPAEAGEAPTAAPAADASVPIEAGTIEVSVVLDVRFELR
jgi:uncharacterized protein YggE